MDGQSQFTFETEAESNEILEETHLKSTDKPNSNNSTAINNADSSSKLDTLWKNSEVNESKWLEIGVSPKCPKDESEDIKNSDVYRNGDSRNYRKNRLRQAPKFKVQNLNEDKLLQFFKKETKVQPQRKKYVVKSENNEKNIFTCMCCKSVFDKCNKLVKHKEEHKNECYDCTKCNISYSSQIVYLRHIYEHMKPPYSCKECLFKTKCRKSIIAHIERHSTRKIECGICKNEFYYCEIGQHKFSHNSMKYECGECGEIKRTKESFEYHMIAHAGVKKFQCLYCGKGYARRRNVRLHTECHTKNQKAYECNECDKKYNNANSLWYHKSNHHSKTLYECDHCGKKLCSRMSIKSHLLLHTKHKLYKCPECPQRFNTKNNLRIHTYQKHIECRFKCEYCSQSFPFENKYKLHLQTYKHKNNVFIKEKLTKK